MSRCSVEYRSTSKEVFKRFKEKYPEIKITYTKWCDVIYSFNYGFRDYLLETGDRAPFPCGFGKFAICKFKPRRTKLVDGVEIIGLPVDWKKTKEYGKKIYHMNYNTEGFKFRWLWFSSSARFEKYTIWNFKPSRVSSRLLKHYLTQENYQYKYLEWKT